MSLTLTIFFFSQHSITFYTHRAAGKVLPAMALFCFVQAVVCPDTMSHSSVELRPVLFLVTNSVSKEMNFSLLNLL